MKKMLPMLLVAGLVSSFAPAEQLWAEYKGGEGAGKGKRVVLVSGDEEYRSEEVLPQLGKILATEHGYDATVVFSVNPDGNYVDATYAKNIPGLEALDSADLMIIFTRFRDLPDAQMQHVDAYLKAGKPVIGIRTSTHAFQSGSGNWTHYANDYHGDKAEWRDGFGRLVLGEHWISHHGNHKSESTRGIFAPGAAGNAILRGIKDGEIWGATDVYGVRLPLPGDSLPLVLGQVTVRAGAMDANDLHYGMRDTDTVPLAGAKNDPMMPIAWTKSYQLPDGKKGTAFTSTIGSSSDFTNAGVRRLLVNAALVITGLADAIPAEGAKVDLVQPFAPTKFEFRSADYWKEKNLKPASL